MAVRKWLYAACQSMQIRMLSQGINVDLGISNVYFSVKLYIVKMLGECTCGAFHIQRTAKVFPLRQG